MVRSGNVKVVSGYARVPLCVTAKSQFENQLKVSKQNKEIGRHFFFEITDSSQTDSCCLN